MFTIVKMVNLWQKKVSINRSLINLIGGTTDYRFQDGRYGVFHQ